MKKGQYLRLFIHNGESSNHVPIAAATNMTLHVSATTENSSTKDTTGDWDEFEVTGLAFDIQSEALVIDNENPNNESNIVIFEEMMTDDAHGFSIAATEGTQNRDWEEQTPICTGQVKLTSLQVTAANRQNSTVSATFNGFGELTVGGASAVSNAPSNSPAPESVTLDTTTIRVARGARTTLRTKRRGTEEGNEEG